MEQSVGKKLALIREQSNLSQAEVGRKTHRSKQYIWALENDKIRLEYLLALELSTIYNVPVESFRPDFSG